MKNIWKNVWKKGSVLAATAALGLSLLACGNSSTVKGTKSDDSPDGEYVYVPEYVTLDEEESVSISDPVILNDKVYYTKYVYHENTDETTGEMIYDEDIYFCYRDLQDPTSEVISELNFEVEGYDSGMYRFCPDEQGNVFVIWNIYPIYVEGQDYDYTDRFTYLIKYDSSMNEVARQDIGEVFADENNTYIQYITVDTEGRVYASSNNLIYVFYNDCSFAETIDTGADWIFTLFASEDGNVFFGQYGMNGTEIAQLDMTAKKVGSTYAKLPDSGENIRAVGDGKLLISGANRLYEYDMATQESTEVLEWLACNVDGDYIQSFRLLEDGRIIVYYDNYEEPAQLIYLTKTEASKVKQKQIITVGTLYEGNYELQSAAVKFNKSNDTYQIRIRNYIDSTAEWTETTYSDALSRMNADITSDNCPDIVDLSNVDLVNLAAKGALEDLTPYLESGQKVNKADFVSSVLQAYQFDGKQVTVPKSFSIATIMGKSKLVGATPGWTLDDVIALADAHPEARLMYYATKEYALQICMRYNSNSFIDYETGKCSFNSPEFIKVLEFANRFQSEYPQDPEKESYPSQLQSEKVLLAETSFYSVEEYQMYRLMLEEEATCIGYPTADGSEGVFIRGSEMYGISSKSNCKDGAWAFMECLLADQDENRNWQFPSRVSVLDKMFEDAMTPEYQYDEKGQILYDENGVALQYPKTSWGYDDWDADIYAATEEEVAEIRAMIDIAKPVGNSAQTVFSMISEEAAEFFSGQKSAEEVAKVIQSRVEIYVSENS